MDGGKSAKEYVEDVLASDHVRKGSFDAAVSCGQKNYQVDLDLSRRVQEFRLFRDVGFPMMIRDFAIESRIPFQVAEREAAGLRRRENVEDALSAGVVAALKKRLNTGAAADLERLENLNAPVVFPRTPIAAQYTSSIRIGRMTC